jgi:TRAP-type C4-dicarboxylate transport system substrate-binding protein
MMALRTFSALLLSVVASSASSQDKKTVLRVADSFPANHYVVEYATKFWMDSVTQATGGAVTFEYYPSEQLGKAKDLLALTQSGVTDVGYVAPSFVSDKMPLSAVGELPGGFATSCAGAKAFWKLVKDGILAKNEFQPSGVRAIFAVVLPPYQLFTKAKLESARNLEGLKIYTAGGAKELAVRKLKAVPIKMATPEVFESLSRGTIDGVLFPYASLFPYNVHTLVKYGTVGESFGSFAATYVISEAKYRQLPANVQKAMTDASEATVTRACALIDKDLDGQIEKAKQSGITLVQFPASERKDVDAAMASVSKEWAEGLDKRGKAGSEVLKAFQDALKTGR